MTKKTVNKKVISNFLLKNVAIENKINLFSAISSFSEVSVSTLSMSIKQYMRNDDIVKFKYVYEQGLNKNISYMRNIIQYKLYHQFPGNKYSNVANYIVRNKLCAEVDAILYILKTNNIKLLHQMAKENPSWGHTPMHVRHYDYYDILLKTNNIKMFNAMYKLNLLDIKIYSNDCKEILLSPLINTIKHPNIDSTEFFEKILYLFTKSSNFNINKKFIFNQLIKNGNVKLLSFLLNNGFSMQDIDVNTIYSLYYGSKEDAINYILKLRYHIPKKMLNQIFNDILLQQNIEIAKYLITNFEIKLDLNSPRINDILNSKFLHSLLKEYKGSPEEGFDFAKKLCIKNNDYTLTSILSWGFDINKNNGELLRLCLFFRSYKSAQILLENGANPNINNGQCFFDALSSGSESLAQLFINKGADILAIPEDMLSWINIYNENLFKILMEKRHSLTNL